MEKTNTYTANGRHLERGTEISIKGERGRFRFLHHVTNGDKEWIDVADKNKALRSFRPEKIKRVHYKKKIRVI